MADGEQIILTNLSEEQAYALDMCESGENIFLTGGAGSGKSYVIREFMKNKDDKQMPILAEPLETAVISFCDLRFQA